MSRTRLALAGRGFTIEAAPEALAPLAACYPHALDAGRPDAAEPFCRIVERGGRWEVTLDGRGLGRWPQPVHAVLALEHELEKALLARLDDRLVLHAGAVAADGAAVVAAGAANRGKTTTVLQLVELGCAQLCEEIAPVDPDALTVEPCLQSLSVAAAYLDELAAGFPLAAGEVRPLAGGLSRYLPRRVERRPLPPRLLLLPRFEPGAAATATPVAPEAALPEALGCCYEPRLDPDRHLDGLIALLETAAVVRLTWGDPPGHRRLLADLLNSL